MYTALAKYYDRLMNVDGDAWADYLCALIGGRDDGADLACGTGAITLRLIARGKKGGIPATVTLVNAILREINGKSIV